MPWYESMWNTIKDFFVNNWTTILIFVAVLIFGIIVIKILLHVFKKIMKRSKLNSMAAKFITSIIKIFLYVIYLIALLSLLGIPTTSLVALVSVGALAISLAVQDVISNFASGIEIVVTKPFVEGDLVEIDGITGNIDRITIVNTRLITPDQRTVVLPNNKISTSSVINYTTQPTRRVDLVISAAYGTDVEKVKEIIRTVIDNNELALKNPEPMIRLNAHGSSSLDFTVRAWSKNADYWTVYFDLHEQILAAFEENGIEIPFDQLDVHVVPPEAKQLAELQTATKTSAKAAKKIKAEEASAENPKSETASVAAVEEAQAETGKAEKPKRARPARKK